MLSARLSSIGMLLVGSLLPFASGCADGFVPELRSFNPWVREQWADDEKYGPTYHQRIAELERVRAQAPSLSPADQQRLSQDIAEVYAIEKSAAMRAELLKSIAEFPTPVAFTTLESAATDNDAEVRQAAARGLSRQKNPQAITLLTQLVSGDGDGDVRKEAARSLGSFKQPEAAKALALALDENDPAIQKIAMDSLRSTTGKDYGNRVGAWREYLGGGNPPPPDPPTLAERVGWPWY